MCNCGDLKYAQKNHTHNYATQAAVDAAIDASGHVGQAEVDAAIAASGHVGQAEVDAAIAASGHVDQAAVDAVIADLQMQIAAINQALIDCGCLPEPCLGFFSDFSGPSYGGATVDTTDWTLSTNALDQIRIQRVNGPDQSPSVKIPINITKQAGMTFDFVFDNQTYIQDTWAYLLYDDGNFVILKNYYNPTANPVLETPYGLTDIPDGSTIIEAEFRPAAIDQSTTFARWILEYVNILCP